MSSLSRKNSFQIPAWSVLTTLVVVLLTILIPLSIWLIILVLAKSGLISIETARFVLGDNRVATIVRIVISFTIEIGLLLAVKWRYKLKLADFGLRKFNLIRTILLILGSFLLFIGLVYLAYLIISVLLPQVNLNEAQKSGFELGRHGSGLVASFIVTVLIAPVIEEVYFRGFLLPAFSARWGDLVGIGLSGMLFGVLHMQINVGIYTFILGVLLGLMYRRTQSIIPGILLHVLNNALAFFVLLKL